MAATKGIACGQFSSTNTDLSQSAFDNTTFEPVLWGCCFSTVGETMYVSTVGETMQATKTIKALGTPPDADNTSSIAELWKKDTAD